MVFVLTIIRLKAGFDFNPGQRPGGSNQTPKTVLLAAARSAKRFFLETHYSRGGAQGYFS
ncbi:hypothetical protein BY457_104200 [Marinilabilia salmonicolor]|jgi:hypothetical protein|nr:hypothetical protein BY457_104200 [Marinilabilia salmonicolor]